MSDSRLSYHRRKFEDEILVKKQEPKCRIWNKEDMNHIIEQLCEQNGTFLRASRSLKQFRVLESIGVKELRYIDPYSHTSLRVIGYEELFNQLYWAWEQTGFAGWKPLHHKIREQGLYISIEIVRLFLEHSPCHQARISKKSQKSLVTNPILSSTFGSRGQVDLIDMRTIPRHESNANSLYNLSMERDTFQKGVKQLSPTFAIVIHRGRKLTDERKLDRQLYKLRT